MGHKSKAPVIGYRYGMDIHMGVSRGPIDALVAIKVGDKVAFTGPVTGTGQVDINQPNLFGGDKGEGGILGTLYLLFGTSDQLAPSWLSELHGALLPGFRRMFTMAFRGLVCSNNPTPQAWSPRVQRALAGWPNDTPWYPEKALIALDDGNGNAIAAMNPAHIIYQCSIDKAFGRGIDPSYLDDAAFRAAADQLYSEGFGLCLRWTRSGPVGDFVQTVIDHIGATLGVDYSTGLLTLELIRDDYDPDTLPLFTPDSGLIAILDDTTSAQETQINEVVVKWVDPVTNDDRQTRAPNIAAVQSMGGVVSAEKDYSGLPTEVLAQRVAVRDVTAATAGLRAFQVTLDRRGYALRPGRLFRIGGINGIDNMVLRAGKKMDGGLTSGNITIAALQDVFGFPDATWLGPSPNAHVPPDQTPLPVPYQSVSEATYRDLALELSPGDLDALSFASSYLETFGARPSGLALSYQPSTEATGETDFVPRGSGTFTATGLLANDMGPTDTTFIVVSGIDLSTVSINGAVLIDDTLPEICRLDNLDASTWTATVGRGCIDTVNTTHVAGTRVWFYEDEAGTDGREYFTGETVQAKLITHTASGDLDPSLAPISSVTFVQRQARPYPPAHAQIDGYDFPDSIFDGDLVSTWAHRDRLLQADQLVDQSESDIGPESGTTYNWRLFVGGVLEHSETGITANTFTYTPIAVSGSFRVEIESQRDALVSLQMQVREFIYGSIVDDSIDTESGDSFETEGGDEIIQE